MNEKTKSLIRHILTALGTLVGVIGLESITGLITFLLDNLDAMWEAILTVVGFVTAILGFIKDANRHEARANVSNE